MSILTSASSTSVYRGYEYYDNGYVDTIKQLSKYEYEGYVKGSRKNPYYVKINVNHPRKSYCDCPFANGNTTCKHMVALYFSIFPNEADDYNEWYNSDYYEEDDYDDEDDYYDNYYEDDSRYRKESFNKPLFFDMVLDDYISNLDEVELRKILKEELIQDEEKTYNKYIKKIYNIYLNNNKQHMFLDRINNKIKNMTNIYNYDYLDYSKVILSNQEKKIIQEMYKTESFRPLIDKMIMMPELAIYSSYRWVVNFYLNNKKQEELLDFIYQLEEYFKTLKYYGIKTDIPKSNVLIALYLFKNFSIFELASSILNNGKYDNYVDYIINNTNYDFNELYNEIIKLVKKNYIRYKAFLPSLLYKFLIYDDFNNMQMIKDTSIYSFLCTGEASYLKRNDRTSIRAVESKTNNKFLLSTLYKYYGEVDKLWELLNRDDNKYLLIDNIPDLKDKYSKELYDFFYSRIYEVLKNGKERKNYHEAAKYVKAISGLNDGYALVDKTVEDLRKSEYQKCLALFDEINLVLK